ncbi:hypothetical protein [Williamsia sp. CHRR-6]|uniref:hypothetical protein n=1 Tax=Williamsia sp. CHRR-6 TaxID=2835871 RepID=UPI001BDAAF3E|nr:hypothetical protein [Williamsia sp. CHRR-6]MBT0566448.1 hypothetical protein [Williamsia sp. CHRR-6]
MGQAAQGVSELGYAMVAFPPQGSRAVSPVSAWVLRETVGIPTDSGSHAAAVTLLRQEHPAIGLSAAIWMNSTCGVARINALADGDTVTVSTELPHDLDIARWVSATTGGSFDALPVQPSAIAGTLALAATSTLTLASWVTPPSVVSSRSLTSTWGVQNVLRTNGAQCGLAWDPLLGVIGVVIDAADGVVMASVIADPEIDPVHVQAAAVRTAARFIAHEAVLLPGVPSQIRRDWWQVIDVDPDVDDAENTAVLPAWSVATSTELVNGELGFFEAMWTGLGGELSDDNAAADAQQWCAMSYHAHGMWGVSVSAAHVGTRVWGNAMLAALRLPDPPPPPPTGPIVRLPVELRFTHPFAVAAVSVSQNHQSPWHLTPLLCAWVAEAVEADG